MPEAAQLDQATADTLTHYLDVGCPCPHADLAFIFGTRLPDPIPLVSVLFHEKRVDWIALTGGVNRQTGVIEAEAHYRLLLEQDVPPERIIVEDRSTSTYENVELAIPMIAARLDLATIASVVAICKWQHSRRALMTLKRFWPHSIALYAQTYETAVIPQTGEAMPITREAWWKYPASAANVLAEAQKIPSYLARGALVDISFVDGVWR